MTAWNLARSASAGPGAALQALRGERPPSVHDPLRPAPEAMEERESLPTTVSDP